MALSSNSLIEPGNTYYVYSIKLMRMSQRAAYISQGRTQGSKLTHLQLIPHLHSQIDVGG